jgi:hypothetical protein
MQNKGEVKIKVLSLYLPQYHEIEENNIWWGSGYTEWQAVKSAKPLYNQHNQPRKPLNNNYYDLLKDGVKTWKWQANLAKDNGVYGFCIYHYWFLGKQLLQNPMEILLQNPDIDINYTICWANESWTRTWYGLETEVLIDQKYGKENDWRKHFNYLLQFFKDKRYIKIDNKPMLNIYRSFDIKDFKEMLNIWNQMAIENGFSGIYIVSGNTNSQLETRVDLVNAYYNFEPGFSLKHRIGKATALSYYLRTWVKQNINKILRKEYLERTLDVKEIYKVNWKKLKDTGKPIFPGTIPMWDNTPRRKYKGFEYISTSPDLFYKNLINIKNSLDSNSDINFIYINAWNEWGEGAYLEPDEKYGYDYLKAIKKALED